MYGSIQQALVEELQGIREAGLYKDERVIMGPQGVEIKVKTGQTVLNFCANNYLGLSSHPEVIAAAHKTLDEWGFGLSSVRFICGTQDIHKTLEQKVEDRTGKLKELQEKQKAILSGIGDEIIVLDRDINIIWANEIVSNQYGNILGKKECEVYKW